MNFRFVRDSSPDSNSDAFCREREREGGGKLTAFDAEPIHVDSHAPIRDVHPVGFYFRGRGDVD